ncbi:MAG: peptide chain release factor 1 [Oscillospiraceae bacterium]|jgi:peptide chain release factor 1|nr:peptide chain release factor 1 [Oscillospiraceae bacterium]
MFENLAVFEKRYEELNQKLYDPAVACDPEKSRELMKEVHSIEPIVEKYREYRATEQTEADAKQILEEESDREMHRMAEDEINTARADRERFAEELKLLLLPRDPNDDKNVIVEIRGGAGGEEAALFSGVLFRMYSMYAQSRGWQTEILNANETELGGFKEVSFMITGDGAYSRLKYESGVHRVQRVPETEQQGRIHTSTATVAVLPEVEEVEFELDPKDLKIDTFRSSGAGGQHINKTSSAIRVTHLPTGTVVECQDERSQYKNKDRALKILRSRLYEQKQKEQDDKVAAERRSQVGTGDRSERIRTYNYPQGRVTDHRIGLTLYRLDAVLNGDLDEILDALIAADRAEKLKNSAENGANMGE